MNLIIDVGNTRVKAAVFEGDTFISLQVFQVQKIISELKKILKKQVISNAIMSNVASLSDFKLKKIENLVKILPVSSSTKMPFKNLYQTPKTLGVDRLGLVAAAVNQYPNKNVLVIDAGSCITYDFVSAKKEYLGGAISVGVQMRFLALHQNIANLPLLSKEEVFNFIGASTKDCINVGVVNGVVKEIEGFIAEYKSKYSDLTVVLTGGDTKFLSKQLKSSIFANQNFLLQGLNQVLKFNTNK